MYVLYTWDGTVLENKEVMPNVTASINHEGIMLSAINQMKKDKFCMASFICGISKLINKQK